MTNYLTILLASILQGLAGLPVLDSDYTSHRLAVQWTEHPPERPSFEDWVKELNVSRLDRTPPDYWKVIKEQYLRRR